MAWGLHASEFVPSACGWAERAQLHTQAAVLGHAQGWDMHVACAAVAGSSCLGNSRVGSFSPACT